AGEGVGRQCEGSVQEPHILCDRGTRAASWSADGHGSGGGRCWLCARWGSRRCHQRRERAAGSVPRCGYNAGRSSAGSEPPAPRASADLRWSEGGLVSKRSVES
ncbi:hypothetical protein T484DRAFT_1883699, partial [Baffinella frigidus]